MKTVTFSWLLHTFKAHMHRDLASKNSPVLVLVMCTLSLAWNVLVLFFGEGKDRMLIPNHHNHSGLDSLYSLATYHGCCRLGDFNSFQSLIITLPQFKSSTYNPGNWNFWLQVDIPSTFNFLGTARCRKKGYHYDKLQLLVAHQQWSAQQSMVVMLLNLKL